MKFKPKYFAVASCIIIVVAIASTAGCTSSSTSSNQQASPAASSGQAASGNPADTTGSDPDPSVMPRYNPSQRISYNHMEGSYATSYLYTTNDTVSQVSSFYKTQMPKLGYTVNVTEERSDYSQINYQKHGKTVGMMLASGGLLGNNTSISVVVMDV
jgi:hypothetical protein